MAEKDDYGRNERSATPDLTAVQVDKVSMATGVLDKKTGMNVATSEKIKTAGIITAITGYLVTAGSVAAVFSPGMLGMAAVGAGAAVVSTVVPLIVVGAAIGTVGVGIALAGKAMEWLQKKFDHNGPSAAAPAQKAKI